MNERNFQLLSRTSDFHCLHAANERFLRGETSWTSDGKRLVAELILSIPLIALLVGFLAFFPLNFTVRIGLLAFFVIVVAAVLSIGLFKLRKELRVARLGQLIPGFVTDCSPTGKGGDYEIFEISYRIEGNQKTFETRLDERTATTIVGKELAVLRLDDENVIVL